MEFTFLNVWGEIKRIIFCDVRNNEIRFQCAQTDWNLATSIHEHWGHGSVWPILAELSTLNIDHDIYI